LFITFLQIPCYSAFLTLSSLQLIFTTIAKMDKTG